MPKAILPTRNEKMFAGEFTYTLTGVQMGHDGIKNLVHWIPFAQNDWKLFQSGSGHKLDFVHDSVTSRVKARQESTNAALHTSIIRARVALPKDFGSFVAVRMLSFRGASSPTLYNFKLIKNGVAETALNLIPTAASTYELKELVPVNAYFPDEFVVFEITLTTAAINVFGDVSDIEVEYKTARGNV